MAGLGALLGRKPRGGDELLSVIEEFMMVRNVAFVRGWCNLPEPSFLIETGRFAARPASAATDRPDLVAELGETARHWGFDLRVVLPAEMEAAHEALRLTVTGVDGRALRVDNLAEAVWPASLEGVARLNNAFRDAVAARPGAAVMEIGARARSGVLRRELYGPDLDYTGVDVMPGEGVDVVADVHFLSDSVPARFDFVHSVSTFEHLVMPWQAAAEIARVMRPGGLILTQTHQAWPVHDAPWDFFRFSRDSWKGLFNEVTGFEVLDTAYGEPAILASTMQSRSAATRLEASRGYLLSSCLARRVGEPRAPRWADREAMARILGGTAYPA